MSLAEPTQRRQRELSYRANGGIEVVLFWDELTEAVTVSVSDTNLGAYFELPADPAHALDVFEHPYAHAAFMGIPYEEESLATWAHLAEQPQFVTAGTGDTST
jgi:hypothetical protein